MVRKTSSTLLVSLCEALLGCGEFTPGKPTRRRSLEELAARLCAEEFLCLVGGEPGQPHHFRVWDQTGERLELAAVLKHEARTELLPLLAGFWRDRDLALLSFRKGLLPAESEALIHLLTELPQRGDSLHQHVVEIQARARLSHVGLLFCQELTDPQRSVPWPARCALGWLQKDLNLLVRCQSLDIAAQTLWRQSLVPAVLRMPQDIQEQSDLLANLDLIVDTVDSFNQDELVLLLMEQCAAETLVPTCHAMCALLGRLQKKAAQHSDEALAGHIRQVIWTTRRVAELLVERGLQSAELYHDLVLRKVYVYEEIPTNIREQVASFQILTSFLEQPFKYFNEVEASSSPEVLASRLWRLLEMLPHLLRVGRSDVVRDVLAFGRRFGPSFDVMHRPELLDEIQYVAAEILMQGPREKQKELLTTLPQMGTTGGRLLLELADHRERSVRRAALDGLAGMGQTIVPLLFEGLEHKPGWHYLRNMLTLLAKVDAGGPKIENFFRQALTHEEPHVRREAVHGLARLLRGDAEEPVAACLNDNDLEVRRRAVVCLALTGIRNEQVYRRLADLLGSRHGAELAEQIVATLHRLRPRPLADPALEKALLKLLHGSRLFGLNGPKGTGGRDLKLGVIKVLGCLGTRRSRKVLQRLSHEPDVALARAARDVLDASSLLADP